jgi:dihydrolipoamide dehydrogenase
MAYCQDVAMNVSEGSDKADVLILGAGSGGYACALRAAELGLQPLLIEEGPVGGTCLHRGCIPTKAALHAAEIADAARDSEQFGVHAQLDRVDLGQVRDYADSVVSRLHKGLTGLLSGRGVETIPGRGRAVSTPDGPAVQVGDRTYQAPHLVLASGSQPKSLPDLEIDGERVLTSEHALRRSELPGSVIILGGGVIGCEFASAWRSFGVDVTIVEALPRLLPAEDPAVSQALERAFKKRKITVHTGAPVTSVKRDEQSVTLGLESGAAVTADVVLVAVGRGPASANQGFEEAGLEMDRGWVRTDERLRTNLDNVYAVGDLVSGLQLAHRGFAHGIFVAEDIYVATQQATGNTPDIPAPNVIKDELIPRITYSNPEIASVGLTEEAAREQFGDVSTLRYDLSGNGRSQILKTQGFVKVVRRPDGPVAGVHMVGARVGELIAEAQLITNWEAYPSEVADLIHPHPTQSEALGEAHLALAGKPLHVHV